MDGVEKLDIRDVEGAAVVAVKVVPSASRDRIAGVLGDCLKITTAAPPEKHKANKAVARMLAEAVGLDKRSVVLVAGATGARKEFRVEGLTADAVRKIMAELPR